MKAAQGCKLFGAYEALSGIQDSVVLLHSVVGCNFGTMAFHAACDMAHIHQTCTVISDTEVVFGGEKSLRKALDYVEELFQPRVIFVVTGCISDMIQDDVHSVAQADKGSAKVVFVEAAGYRGKMKEGQEAAMKALAELAEAPVPASKGCSKKVILAGLGADDFRLVQDTKALQKLAGENIELQVLANTTAEKLEKAANADLILTVGYGEVYGKRMNQKYGIPWKSLDYPYGLTGAQEFWQSLGEQFGDPQGNWKIVYETAESAFRSHTGESLSKVYSYLQALYSMPAAVIGAKAKCHGMKRFLEQELGMEVVVCEEREQVTDVERFYDKVRQSEAAVLFGSSFERELAEELEIPLIRFDYPVFDRLSLSGRCYVGEEGSLCLVEDILNEIMAARNRKGALYQ